MCMTNANLSIMTEEVHLCMSGFTRDTDKYTAQPINNVLAGISAAREVAVKLEQDIHSYDEAILLLLMRTKQRDDKCLFGTAIRGSEDQLPVC